MKTLCFVLLILLTTPMLAAENSNHMVMFGNSFSTGISGAAGQAEVDSELGIDDYNLTEGGINLNYSYRVSTFLQLGFDYSRSSETREVKYKTGGKINDETTTTSALIFGLANFSDDLRNSFYIGAGIGRRWVEDDSEDSTVTPAQYSSSDSSYDVLLATFGKRFDLKFIGINNLTYSPSITYYVSDINGDLKDEGANKLSVVLIDFVKFDLLF